MFLRPLLLGLGHYSLLGGWGEVGGRRVRCLLANVLKFLFILKHFLNTSW